jgi:hypothetical protein
VLVRAIASEYRVVTVTHDVTHSALDCDSTSRHKQTSEAQTGPRSFHETVTKSPTCFLTFRHPHALRSSRRQETARARAMHLRNGAGPRGGSPHLRGSRQTARATIRMVPVAEIRQRHFAAFHLRF